MVAALKSKRGASYKLISIIDEGKFQISISVSLLFEYEDVLKRENMNFALENEEIDNILDYICKIADRREIFYLWRPYLKDPRDDLILELAVESESDFIITYNKKDFKSIDKFGLQTLTPKEFLEKIGEI
jgi:putative PIN family toxin of toxin-antitoxin system